VAIGLNPLLFKYVRTYYKGKIAAGQAPIISCPPSLFLKQLPNPPFNRREEASLRLANPIPPGIDILINYRILKKAGQEE
jgi:hypothetical protein